MKAQIIRNYKTVFFIFLILLGIYRFSFLGSGARNFPDEIRYDSAVAFIDSFLQGDYKKAVSNIGQTDGRPGDVIIHLIPAAIQRYLETKWHLDWKHYPSLLIPTGFNVLFSLATVWLFFQISLLLFHKKIIQALCITIVYSLLTNTTCYLRHIASYDIALFFFLLCLWIYLKRTKASSKFLMERIILLCGFISAFAWSIYPGYYFLTCLCAFLFLFPLNKYTLKEHTKNICIYLLPFLLVFLFYEILTRYGNESYFLSMKRARGAVTQGSFEESYLFLFKYLISVEGPLGILLAFGLFGFFYKYIFFFKKYYKTYNENYIFNISLYIFLVYLFHATLGVFFHKLVFYGRHLHGYFPFIIWMASFTFFEIKNIKLQKYIGFSVLLCLSYNIYEFNLSYRKLAYPLDAFYQFELDRKKITNKNFFFENQSNYQYKDIERKIIKSKISLEPYLLANLGYLYPISESYDPFINNYLLNNARLLFSGLHFLCYKGYAFEGFSIQERAILKARKYYIQVYKTETDMY